MWIYEGNVEQVVTLPREVAVEKTMENGNREVVRIPTGGFDRREWDEAGYNEAVSAKTAPYTIVENRWVKGDDLVYREELVSVTIDEEARIAHIAEACRVERDRRLSLCDWTQVQDAHLNDTAIVQWQSYRQALRDVPQQAGFPETVEWPESPEIE